MIMNSNRNGTTGSRGTQNNRTSTRNDRTQQNHGQVRVVNHNGNQNSNGKAGNTSKNSSGTSGPARRPF